VQRHRSTVPAAMTAGAVAAVLTLAGCGSDSPSGTQAGPAATAPAAGTPPAGTAPTATADGAGPAAQATNAARVKTITVRVADGKVTPKPGRVSVARGETVRLVVTSDVADEVHVHAYDQEAPLTPGKPATLQFVASQPGLFEVETHHSGLILFQLLVR